MSPLEWLLAIVLLVAALVLLGCAVVGVAQAAASRRSTGRHRADRRAAAADFDQHAESALALVAEDRGGAL